MDNRQIREAPHSVGPRRAPPVCLVRRTACDLNKYRWGDAMATVSTTAHAGEGISHEERRVILASSVGTIFEWYDFYLYATLAPFFAALFFPPGNDTAALLSAFATYAAGFLIRPFGAIIFGRIGDLVGRKYTFLVTIFVMGLAPLRSACCRPSARTPFPSSALFRDRLDRPRSACVAALAARLGARRRIRRCRHLCCGAFAPR